MNTEHFANNDKKKCDKSDITDLFLKSESNKTLTSIQN